jgi:sterol desaturase/sphingolipid hydroxylase (fatty acid hydroxylase superfamily)
MARGYTEERAFVVAATAIHVATYFGMFGFFEFIEHFKLLRQYKLARTPGQEPTNAMKVKTVIEFLVGQVLNAFALGPLVFRNMQKRGGPSGLEALPSLGTMWYQFMVAYALNKWGFTMAHRLAHHGPLYRAIHKKHHQYVGACARTNVRRQPAKSLTKRAAGRHGVHCGRERPSRRGYRGQRHAHAGGHASGGGAPARVPRLAVVRLLRVLGRTDARSWRLEETFESHSGYCFAGSWLHKLGLTNADNAAYHDHHHVVNRGNFGDPLSDYVMGTNDAWLATGGNEGYIGLARAQHEKEKAAP